MSDVVVLDYGSGNVRSAVRALEQAGASVRLSSDRQEILEAKGLVVPGVGAFASVMDSLQGIKAPELIGRRIAGSRAVLGICVGMQVMFEYGVEHGHNSAGLGQWPGTVERLHSEVVPHMGWNQVQVPENSKLFSGIEQERFYFVHSYGVRRWEMDDTIEQMRSPLVSWTEQPDRFIAAVENGPISATQFHPEKSGQAGIQLLRNWLASL